MAPMAERRGAPGSQRPDCAIPGAGGGASSNQKNAMASRLLPTSKKKCCPLPLSCVTFRIICRDFSIMCRMTRIKSHQLDRSRSLFHHRDECGFNGLQACDDR